jgi:hypothetical protein
MAMLNVEEKSDDSITVSWATSADQESSYVVTGLSTGNSYRF